MTRRYSFRPLMFLLIVALITTGVVPPGLPGSLREANAAPAPLTGAPDQTATRFVAPPAEDTRGLQWRVPAEAKVENPWNAALKLNPPAPVMQSPVDGALDQGISPELRAELPGADPASRFQFKFTVCEMPDRSAVIRECIRGIDSPWMDAPTWKVPPGYLSLGHSYLWTVVSRDERGKTYSPLEPAFMFSTDSIWGITGPAIRIDTPTDFKYLSTATPELRVSTPWTRPGHAYGYTFQLADEKGAVLWSTTGTSPSVKVPDNTIAWGRNYLWKARVFELPDGPEAFGSQTGWVHMQARPPIAAGTRLPDRAPEMFFTKTGTGGLTDSVVDGSIPVVGSPVAVKRTYDSTDTRPNVLGTGWSSILDARVTQTADAPGPVVRMPEGHDLSYAKNPDGSYVPATGSAFPMLYPCPGCQGWTVRDASGSEMQLDDKGPLGLTDQYGHHTTFARGADGRTSKITDDASGRALNLTWTGAHVTAMSASPATAGVEWRYTYQGDKLTSGCVPSSTSTPSCTRYEYTSSTAPDAITKIVSGANRTRLSATYKARGVLAKVTTASGESWSWTRIASFPNPSIPSSQGGVTAIAQSDKTSRRVNVQIDDLQRVLRASNGEGFETWEYDDAGRVGVYVGPTGLPIQLRYDTLGRMINRLEWRDGFTAVEKKYRYTENAARLQLSAILDPRTSSRDQTAQVLTGYEYDPQGRLVSTISGSPADKTLPRATTKYSAGTEAAQGGGTVPSGLVLETNNLGEITKYQYASNGNVATRTDPRGKITSFTYDPLGRVTGTTSTADGVSVSTHTTVGPNGAALALTRPKVADPTSGITREVVSGTEYDVGGNVTATSTEDLVSHTKHTTKMTYDSAGRLETVVTPDGVTSLTNTYDASGCHTGSTDARGLKVSTTCDPLGRPIKTVAHDVADSLNATPHDVTVHNYTYDDAGRVTSDTDAAGRQIKYSYAGGNLLTRQTVRGAGEDQDREVLSAKYDAMGNPVTRTEYGNRETRITYDAKGRRTSASTVVNESALQPTHTRRNTWTYDATGQLIREATDDGTDDNTTAFTTYRYQHGQVVHTESGSSAVERSWDYTYNQQGQLTSVSDPRATAPGDPAFTTSYTYDLEGNPASTAGPEVSVDAGPTKTRPTAKTGYDSFGRATATMSATGATSRAELDAMGRPLRVTEPSIQTPTGLVQPVTTLAYTAAGDAKSVTDPAGNVTEGTIDNRGLLTSVTEPATNAGGPKRTTTLSYDDAGRPVAQVSPDGLTQATTYDALGRTSKSSVFKAPLPARNTTIEYDNANNPIKVTDPTGATTSSTYNNLGEVTSSTDADQVSVQLGYDVRGLTTKTKDGQGRYALQAHNDLGLTTATSQHTADTVWTSVQQAFDKVGNPTVTTKPLGSTTTQTWDGLNRLTSDSYATTDTYRYGYDADGRQTRLIEPNGATTTSTHDPAGNTTQNTAPETPAHPALFDRTQSLRYTLNGQLAEITEPGGTKTTFGYTPAGSTANVTATGNGSALTKSFTYDVLGQPTQAREGTDAQALSYTAFGELESAKGPSGDSSYTYDQAGRPSKVSGPAGDTSYTYTAAGRLGSVNNPRSGTFAYHYDNTGAPQTVDLPNQQRRTFTYDGAGRVTADTTTAGATPLHSTSYGYDQAGRTTSQGVTTAAGSSSTTYGYDTRDRVTSWDRDGQAHTYRYDANNNIVGRDSETSTYDQRNRLQQRGSTTYTYTPAGQRATETSAGTTRTYAWDAFGRLSNNGSQQLRYDVFDRLTHDGTSGRRYNGLDPEAVATDTASWTTTPDGTPLANNQTTLLTNKHTDVSATVGETAAPRLTDPFGAAAGPRPAEAGDRLFQGQYTSNNLTHMGERWYDSSTGTFLSADKTTGLSSTDLNRYTYASNSPLDGTDPTGQFAIAIPIGAAIAGAVVVGIGLTLLAAGTIDYCMRNGCPSTSSIGQALFVSGTRLGAQSYGKIKEFERSRGRQSNRNGSNRGPAFWPNVPQTSVPGIGDFPDSARRTGSDVGRGSGSHISSPFGPIEIPHIAPLHINIPDLSHILPPNFSQQMRQLNADLARTNEQLRQTNVFLAEMNANLRIMLESLKGLDELEFDPKRATLDPPQRDAPAEVDFDFAHAIPDPGTRPAEIVLPDPLKEQREQERREAEREAQWDEGTPANPDGGSLPESCNNNPTYCILADGQSKPEPPAEPAAPLTPRAPEQAPASSPNIDAANPDEQVSGDGLTTPGPFAGESVEGDSTRKFRREQRDRLNEIMRDTGCHRCGVNRPGTNTGDAIPDHQPPLSRGSGPYRLFPHCLACSRLQGLHLANLTNKERRENGRS